MKESNTRKTKNFNRFIGTFGTLVLLGSTGLSSFPASIFAADDANKTAETKDTKDASQSIVDKFNAARNEKLAAATKAYKAAALAQLQATGDLSSSATAEDIDATQKIRVMVQLAGDAAVKKTAMADGSAKSIAEIKTATAKVTKAQKSVKSAVEKLAGTKVVRDFGYLVNGFSIDIPYGEVDAVKALDGVSSVTALRVSYQQDANANDMANISKVWESHKLKGEGMIISIIDSGVDPTHKDLKLTDDSTAELTEAEANTKVSDFGYGKYFTAKVPFGHNYADNNEEITDTTGEMHGQHVTGIAAANGEVVGVAPEAQVLAMKVFTNNKDFPSCLDDDVIAAIEDSVTLGADVLNMSLGSVGASVDPEDPREKVIAAAAAQGVISVISAGNSSTAGSSDLWSNPKDVIGTDDQTTVGAPSVTSSALSVASAENTMQVVDLFSSDQVKFTPADAKLAAEIDGGLIANSKVAADYSALSQPTEVVDCGIGADADFAKVDVKGKIALIQRGSIDFTKKVDNAKKAGAVAAFVYDNVDGALINMAVTDESYPTLFISKKNGEELLAAMKTEKTFNFTRKQITINNPNTGKMSTFSSWGPTPELDFKPEITAPGGQIYSLANSDQYQSMNGTSMASPFVAGSEALVIQSLRAEGLDTEDASLVQTAKNLIMNTADPMYDKDYTNEIISPRRQGAGLLQVDEAVENAVSLVDSADGDAALALKEIDGSTTFSVTLENHGTETKTFTYDDFGGAYTQVTDKDQNLYDTVIPNATVKADTTTVTVAPNETKDVQVTVTVPSEFENNQFVEGYVGFSTGTDGEEVVIPYVGYYGDYDGNQVLATDSYETDGTFAPTQAGFMISGDAILGLQGDKSLDKNAIAISPNDDDSQDNIQPYLYFLRNYSYAKYEVFDDQGVLVQKIRESNGGSKDYFDSSAGDWTVTNDSTTTWNGTKYNTKLKADNKDEIVPDGQYEYRISVTPESGGNPQVYSYPVKVDTVAPKLADFKVNMGKDVSLTLSDDFSGISDVGAVAINGEVTAVDVEKVDNAVNQYTLADISDQLKPGRNWVQLAFYDEAGNIGLSEVTMVDGKTGAVSDATTEAAINSFTIAEGMTLSKADESVYDKKTGWYVAQGSYIPNTTLYINGYPAMTDDKGVYQIEIPLDDDQGNPITQVVFSKDKAGKDVITTYDVKVDVTDPTINVSGVSAGMGIINVTGDTYHLAGKTDAVKLVLMDAATMVQTELEIVNGTFSADIPVVFGQSAYVLNAVDDAGNSSIQMIVVNAADSKTYNGNVVSFDDFSDPAMFISTQYTDIYDGAKQELTVKGKLQYPVDNFTLNGEVVTVNPDTLEFSYVMKNIKNGKNSLTVYAQDDDLNDGKPLMNYAYLLILDNTLPTMSFPGLTVEANGNYGAYTNKNPYVVKATIDDNMAGYNFFINDDNVYADTNSGTFNEDKYVDREAKNIEYPVTLQDGLNYLYVGIQDTVGNYDESEIDVDYKVADLDAPVITSDNTELTTSEVLSATNKTADEELYYSTDGSTWTLVPDDVSVVTNGEVFFKYQDKYGNESKVTTYDVTNIRNAVAAGVEVSTASEDPTKSVTVTLDFDAELTEEQQKENKLQYSLDGGATWLDYTAPVVVTETTEVYARVLDVAGNVSEVKKAKVTIEAAKEPTKDISNGSTKTPVDSSKDKDDDTNNSNDNTKVSGKKVTGVNVNGKSSSTSSDKANKVAGKDFPKTGEAATATNTLISVLGVMLLGSVAFFATKKFKKESK